MTAPDIPPRARRALRARAVEKAGGVPCPGCGGATSGGLDDVCDCGSRDVALAARCLRNAQEVDA